jgi:hypothetical protein
MLKNHSTLLSSRKIRSLGEGFVVEVDTANQDQWTRIGRAFADANLFQSWSYGVARTRPSRLGHLALKRHGHVVGFVQMRLVGLPYARCGIAYARWGPLWKLRDGPEDPEVFRQAVRAIRNEYAIRRGLIVRLLPALEAQEHGHYGEILREEGYEFKRGAPRYRTILMDLRAPLDELERGFHQKWRKHLNRARENKLEIIEGQEDALFEELGAIYREMLARKRFSGHADIDLYRRTQQRLAPDEKMTVVLCRQEGESVAGALFSALGDTAVDLYRATSDRGLKTYGSYLVQWRVLEHLKKSGCQNYNLNGVNPARNPGGYQFKSQLAGRYGREVDFLGPFDTYPNPVMRMAAEAADRLRAGLRPRRGSHRRLPDADQHNGPSGTNGRLSDRHGPRG